MSHDSRAGPYSDGTPLRSQPTGWGMPMAGMAPSVYNVRCQTLVHCSLSRAVAKKDLISKLSPSVYPPGPTLVWSATSLSLPDS